MVRRLAFAVGLVVLTALTTGCFRDGYVCNTNSDCFSGEVCESGSCVASSANNACRPASDADLCAAAQPCQAQLEVTDSCGVLRQVTCECTDSCVPETVTEICAEQSATCGSVSQQDSCGNDRTVNCGLCTAPEACIDNECSPCATPMCPADAECGEVTNSCGDVTTCPGTCPADELCIDLKCTSPMIQPDEVVAGDRFGETIKLDGDWLLIGAPYADHSDLTDPGLIFVYERTSVGWSQRQVISSPVPEDDGRFGQVFDARDGFLYAVSGSYVVTLMRDNAGTYTFRVAFQPGSPVVGVGLLDGIDALTAYEDTGMSDTLHHGDCNELSGCNITGVPWAPPNQAGEIERLGLGYAIDTAGTNAIVGAPYDNVTRTSDVIAEGGFYLLAQTSFSALWSATGWSTPMTFYRYENQDNFPDAEPTELGRSVAITEDGFAGAGSPTASPEAQQNNSGEIYLMMPGENQPYWLEQRFVSPGTAPFRSCGQSIAFTGPRDSKLAVVSCVYAWPRDRAGELNSLSSVRTIGEFIVYQADLVGGRWSLQSDANGLADGQEFDHFGWTVEANEETVFIGAPGRDDDRGAVYFYPTDELLP